MPFIQYDTATTVTQGGGGTTYTDLTTWDSRSAGSDGDYGIASTGQSYRYSTTAGDWIRPEVYAGTVANVATIAGDSTSPSGWVQTIDAGSAINQLSSPSRVELDGGTTAADRCFLHYDHGTTGTTAYIQGYAQVTRQPASATSFAAKSHASFRNGTVYYGVGFQLNSSTLRAFIPNSTNSVADVLIKTVDCTTSEVWFEMVVEAGSMWVYFDHETTPSLVYNESSTLPPTGVSYYIVGDAETGDSSALAVRDITCCTW